MATPTSEPVWVGDARAVRVRLVRGHAHAHAHAVTVERIQSPRAADSANVAGAATVAMPGIISRPEWGADENLRLANCPEPPDISTNVTIAAVHHTGGNNNYRPQDTPAIKALAGLLAWKLNWHGVDPTRPDSTRPAPWPTPRSVAPIGGLRAPRTYCRSSWAIVILVRRIAPVTLCIRSLPNIRLNVASRILSGGAAGMYPHVAPVTKPKIAVMSAYGVVYPAGGAGEFGATAVWPG